MSSERSVPTKSRRRRPEHKYRAQSEGPHELRPQVGFLPQLVRDRDRDGPPPRDEENGVTRDGALVGFGGGGTYGSPEHISRLESQLAAAQKEIERLRMRLKHSDDRNRQTEGKAGDQAALLLRESTRHERFATLIKAAEAENKRLAKRLAQADRRTTDDIRQLELTISSMEEECHSLRIERDTMEEEFQREWNRASQHEFAAKRQTMDHGALVKALSVTKEEKGEANTRLQEVESDLLVAQDEAAMHKVRYERMESETEQLREAVSQADEPLDSAGRSATDRLTEVEEELENTRTQQARATAAVDRLEDDKLGAEDHWRQKIDKLRQEIDSAAKSGDWKRERLLGILLQARGSEYSDYHDDIGQGLADAQAEAAAAVAAVRLTAERPAAEVAEAEAKGRKATPVDMEARKVPHMPFFVSIL